MGITFDQYQRYKTIQLLVKNVKEYYDIDKVKILEVGSNEQLNLQKFLPDEDITYSDLSIPNGIDSNVKFIEADATNLEKINDAEFDIVISSDVFEHIPEERRFDFLKETSRVAKLLNVNCFPFFSESVKSAELRANEYYKAIYGKDHIWLSEHIENGLPNINELKNNLDKMNKNYFMFEHGDILVWEEMTKSTFYSYCTPELILYQDKIDDFYKKNVFINDVGENNYRKFIVVSNNSNFISYLEKIVHNIFSKEISERNLNFIYRNIQDMQAIAQFPMYKDKKEKNTAMTLYFDNGNGFNEEYKVTCDYKIDRSKGNIEVLEKVPRDVKSIRFDPIEGKAAVLNSLNIVSNNGYVEYKVLNGFTIDNYIIFNNDDPQIIIDLSEQSIEWLKIQANISVFEYNTSVDILNKLNFVNEKMQELNNNLIEKDNAIEALKNNLMQKDNVIDNFKNISQEKDILIKNLNAELEHYKLHYNAAINQREELKIIISKLEDCYNIISNSTCWKMTKPIRIILDTIKKILKSNKHTHLFCKGIKSLKNNGFQFTLKKVINKFKKNKAIFLSNEERLLQSNTKFDKDIKFSIIVPLYNTPKNFLKEMINSCINQTYKNWELCLANGSDKRHRYVERIIKNYMKKDGRIKYKLLVENKGISENTNECIKMANGEYIALFDHDDLLHPSALFEYMKVICDKNADFIYCDEDKFENDINERFDPNFKPDFAIDNLRANNYICHFTVFRRELLEEVGLFRKEFDGSQDHDMILRLIEKAQVIAHVPKILYHWRVSSISVASDPYAKPYTIKAGINAVTEHLNRCNLKGKVESSKVHPNIYRIKYDITGNPLISILIPNKDHVVDLSRCINSIFEKSTYKNIEIVIIENNSTEKETFDYYKTLEVYDNVKVITYKSNGKFNYSAINNFGVKYASGEHLLFLNNDIEIISENWLEEMLMYSQRNDVGAVGAKLYYPNNTIQHAGLGIGLLTLAGHFHRYFDRNSTGYMGNLFYCRNVSGVTAACVMMRKNVFIEINGFDETFEVAFNDVDLCMRIRKEGYLIVWTPYAEAYHYESISRGLEDTTEKQERFNGEIRRFQERWKKELKEGDPYYNPNLTLDKEDFSFKNK